MSADLLPTAFTSLNNPCLSEFWNKSYPAMPGAIALCGIFLVVVVEMLFHPPEQYKSASSSAQLLSTYPMPAGLGLSSTAAPRTPQLREGSSTEQQEQALAAPTSCDNGASGHILQTDGAAGDEHQGGNGDSMQSQHQRLILQCTLLEIGILFHSVFIGMALSVSTGGAFLVLLVAIIFHQTFEGLALGARIASIDWAHDARRPWIMALAYGSTTPVGQAIGLATHSLYVPTSATGLVLVGTMNAISSGLLIYASLVELLAEDFLSERSWELLYGRTRVYACVCVFMGAFSMALVGAWA